MIRKKLGAILLLLFTVSVIAVAAESITVINKTGYDIYYLNISPDSTDDWGEDLLGDEVLMNGESVKISLDSLGDTCILDIQAIDEDDDSYIKWDFNSCEKGKVVLTIDDLSTGDSVGSVQDFTILNDTGFDIYYIFLSPDYSDDWEEDVLGEDEVLLAGESYDVTFSGYGDDCSFDVRLVDEEGDSYTKWGVDLCSTYTLTITLDDIDY
ncbi:MAG: hypothetical protein JEZ04_08515 [Spirochaetales bacterium]|nr:hypothetical protein [Spirochaetales bacterium]